ncbi:ABC transporter substrate-binding protein [Salinicola endophyticus]|uniref:ABC transporter substrate-binding protein n=1 Tax=Salinicola endophyticus TaxID=1949083 RepID=A0ABY8FGE4_9GAMM|nr:ABC transporter substrate-binding protein [Salinicola endophyticus]WFF41870.1 ABC transporter substrate-binding protein [Salinicola endophyticus]
MTPDNDKRRWRAGLLGLALSAAALSAHADTRGEAAASPQSPARTQVEGQTQAPPQESATADKRIALSNNYAGNAWRQQMLAAWQAQTAPAVKTGVVAAADAFTIGENQPTDQAAQIQNLILQGYDAIVIDAASTTALNGAVQEACDAGVVVVSFDGIVTAPCAWKIVNDFHAWGREQVDYMAKRFPDGANLLEVRGLPGTFVDDDLHQGIVDELKHYPKLHIVSSVEGDWAQDVTQQAVAGVLPSLPHIDGVLNQGGEAYGVAQAFRASQREMPVIIFSNAQDELAWWAEQHRKNGYQSIAISNAPGIAVVAFWVAQRILAGEDVPKQLTVPLYHIRQDQLSEVLAHTPKGSVADQIFTRADVEKLIQQTRKAAAPGTEAATAPAQTSAATPAPAQEPKP